MTTRARDPINIKLMDVNRFLGMTQSRPVTSHRTHTPSDTTLHPDGLYSEVIFGQLGGSTERLSTFGYIDLRAPIFHPLVYKNLVSIKSLYSDIMKGTANVIFDEKERDFVRSDSEYAETGYSFFLEHFNKIQFKDTGSLKRRDKVSIMTKYKDLLLISKLPVMPAGIRDIRTGKDGRMESEEINSIYLSILALSKGLPMDTAPEDISMVYDALRFSLQIKTVELYDYILNMISGKKGYAAGRFGARAVAYGSRNVITAANLTEVVSPDAPNYLAPNEIVMPVFQAAKSAMPLMVHYLRRVFFEQVFQHGSTTISLIDHKDKDYSLSYHEISDKVVASHSTDLGIEKWIDVLIDNHIRHSPVTVPCLDGKDRYMYLTYVDDDVVYFLRNVVEFISYLGGSNFTTEPITDKLESIKELGVDLSDVVVVGSSAMSIRGYPYWPEDIDIRVPDRVLDKISKIEGVTDNGRSYGYKNVEIYKPSLEHDDYRTLVKKSTEIDGLMVLKNEHILANYQKSNRTKDVHKRKWLSRKIFDPSKLRPTTYGEILYVATYSAVRDKHTTAVRYPVTGPESSQLNKIHLVTTSPSKVVKLRMVVSDEEVTLPHFPVIGANYQESVSVHPSLLAGFGGDHDGDTVTTNVIFGNESNKEIAEYHQSLQSVISPSGGILSGLGADALIKYQLYTLGYMPES